MGQSLDPSLLMSDLPQKIIPPLGLGLVLDALGQISVQHDVERKEAVARKTTSFFVPIHPHDAVIAAITGDVAEVGVQLPVKKRVGSELKLGAVCRKRHRVRPGVAFRVVDVDTWLLSLEVDGHNDVEAGVVDFAQLTAMTGVNGAVQFMGYPTGVTESRLFGSDSRTILA